METLDHEKFESIKELAAIQAKIAEGRAVLSDLESNKEAFLSKQSEELREKLKQTLIESREYIADIEKYHSELVEYRKQTDSFVQSLRYFSEFVVELSSSLGTEITDILNFVEETGGRIEEGRKEVNRGLSQVKDEKASLKVKEELFQKEKAKLKDKEETLKRAIERLKTKRV